MDITQYGLFGLTWLLTFEAAYHDYKRKEIPDVVNAAIWVFMALLSVTTPMMAVVTAFTFTLIFGLNSALATAKGTPILSWGDVLLIPPIAGIMAIMPPTLMILLLALLIAFFRSYQKEEPIAPYILGAYSVFVICLI